MNGKLLLLSLKVLFLLPIISYGQITDITWYVGDRVIEFHKTTKEPAATNNTGGILNGPGAVVENPSNGNVMFYTDGVNVYDGTGQVMVNGTGLTGDVNGNQPVVVAQVPGNPNQYYIITNSATGAIEMAIVDMTLQGNAAPIPLGEVISKNVAVPGLTNQSDGMIVIPRSNGEFFLITHTEGTTTYNITLFTSTGPQAFPPATLVGSIFSVSNFSFNPATNQLLVSPGEPNRNIEILDFSPDSGSLAFNTALPLSFTSNPLGIYDAQFSPTGNYVYISGYDNNGQPDLLQYDLNNITLPPPSFLATPQSVLPASSNITASYGIQMGPDSVLYHLYEEGGQIRMGLITMPDSSATDGVGYDNTAFNGDFSERQFSSTVPSHVIPLTLDFTFDPPCMNVPVKFFPSVSHPVDSIVWFNGAERLTAQWSPLQTFDAAGTYNISFKAYINGVEVATSPVKPVTVADTQVQVSVDPEVTGCYTEFKEPINPPPGFIPCGESGGGTCLQVTAQVQNATSMQWYGPDGIVSGATGATFSPPSPGYYWILATGGGCTYSAGVLVKQYDTQDPQAFNWYFGNQAGVDFNPVVEQPIPGDPIDISGSSAMNAPQGTATISDRNGNVIFYTDGQSVWLKDNPTPIETNLGGSPNATQSSLIMPVPGDETLFYIFTTDEVTEGTFELRYAVFDRKLDPVNGLGDIVDPTPGDPTDSPSTVLFTNATEQILGVDNWIIVHEFGNNTFRAYQITTEGISEPVYSNVGLDHSILNNASAEGYMSYGAGRIAISNGNAIEYFDFDATTGEVTNGKSVPAPGPVYGLAFSSSGEKMYATVLGDNNIYEYTYDTIANEYENPVAIAPAPTGQPGAIVRGLNGLQVAVQGAKNLGLINEEPIGTPSTYTPNSLPFTLGGTVTLGLPNFVQVTNTPIQEPSLVITNACAGGDVVFTAQGKDPTIDQFEWTFHDGATATGPEVTKNYPTAGTFTVEVLIWNKCMPKIAAGQPGAPGGEEFIDSTFTVNPLPLPPAFGNGEICGTVGVKLKGFSPQDPDFLAGRLSYFWSTGSTDSTITVVTAGTYSVTVTNAVTGCSVTDDTPVSEHFPALDLGTPGNMCEGVTPQTFVAPFFQGATYTWTVDNNPVTTTTPNEFTFVPGPAPNFPGRAAPYVVRVVMSDAVCSQQDDVLVNVNALPTIALAGPPVGDDCDPLINTGEFTVNIDHPQNHELSYVVTRDSDGAVQSQDPDLDFPPKPFVLNVPGLSADTYTVFVRDNLTSCPATHIQPINGASLVLDPPSQAGACDGNVQVSVNITAGSPNYSWQLIHQTSGNVIAQAANVAGPTITTSNLSGLVSGNSYLVRVTDATNCVTSEPITINLNAPFQVSIDLADICAAQNQASAVFTPNDPTATFKWVAGGISGSDTGPSVTLNPGTWNVTLTVDGDDNIACPGSATRQVPISAPVNVSYDNPPPCSNPIQLTASVDNPVISYRWERNNNGTITPYPSAGNPATTNVITIPSTENGNVLSAFVTTANGCEYPDPAVGYVVDIIPPFNVFIQPLPQMPCEGTDFQLTATTNSADPGNVTFAWTRNGNPAGGGSPLTNLRDGGSYIAEGTLRGCTYESQPYVVTVNPKPAVDLGPLRRICPFPAAPDPLENVTLDPGQFVGYEWYTVGEGGALTPLNNSSRQHIADFGGTYRVEVFDGLCTNTDDVEVIEECDPIITGPNAFRPGSGNTENRVFDPIIWFISEEDFQVMIFNRWGEMVYESTQLEFKWNGGYKGDRNKPLPPGTYAYVIRYRSEYFPEQGVKEKRGGVVLLQ